MNQPDDVHDRITEAWVTVLGHDNFEDEDDFFAVGGDSMRATLLVRTLSRAGLDVGIGDFMRNPTVAGLVALAIKEVAGAGGSQQIRAIPR